MEHFKEALSRYADFTGRTRRKGYWMFVLFYFIFAVIVGVVDGVIGTAPVLGGLYSLALLLPYIAVTVRRLHDTGRSGWWILIALLPLIGGLVLLVFMVLDSEENENEYGANPKQGELG